MITPERDVSQTALDAMGRRIPGLIVERIRGATNWRGEGTLEGLRFSIRYYSNAATGRADNLSFKLFTDDDVNIAASWIKMRSQDGEPTDEQWVELVCRLVSTLVRVEREWQFSGSAVQTHLWLVGDRRGRPETYTVNALTRAEAYGKLPDILGAHDFAQAGINPVSLTSDPLEQFGDPLTFEIVAE